MQDRIHQVYYLDRNLALMNKGISDEEDELMFYSAEASTSTTFTLDSQNIQTDNFLRVHPEEETLYYYLTNFKVSLETKLESFDTSTFRTDEINRLVNLKWFDYLLEQINLRQFEQAFSYSDLKYEERILKDIQKSITQGNIEKARRQISDTLEYLPNSYGLNKLKNLLEPPRVLSSTLSPRKKRDKEREWLEKNSKKFRGKWVALVDDELIASNKNLSKVIRKTRNKYDLNKVLLHFVPK